MLQVSTETVERLLPGVDQAIRAGDMARAEAICRQVLALLPRHARALQRLGLSLAFQQRTVEAVEAFNASLAVAPDADTWNDLGAALATLGRTSESVQAFEAALAINPHHLRARLGLAYVLKLGGHTDLAEAAYRQVLEQHADNAEAWLELGRLLLHSGRAAQAIAPLEKAAALAPGSHEIHNDLGVAYQLSGRSDQAIAAFGQSIGINPHYLAAHSNLGNEYKFRGRLGDAEQSYRRAIGCNRQFAETYNNLATVLLGMARCDEAVEVYRQALALKPDFAAARSGYLYCLNLLTAERGEVTADSAYQEHREWEKFCGAPAEARFATQRNDRSPERRLKVGYVSADFRAHPVAIFMENILARHTRGPGGFEVFCYSDPLVPDDMTEHLKGRADHWRSIHGWTDARVAEQVRDDGIDILVDLHGHTAGGHLRVFTMKPAPVQVTYLGYPATTGLSTMDYRITDGWADPAGETERFHSEKLVRLPETFLCFRVPPDVPAPEPRDPRAPLTFASFSALPKITPQTVDLWTGILREVTDSRLLIKTVGMGDESVRGRVLRMFAERGIADSRLILLPPGEPYLEHLATHRLADIALDPFPYHGTTTTCEALYMGVPVVTLAGKVHAGRVGVSILNNVGLPELVAHSASEYCALAVNLARDGQRQTNLRTMLREKMMASPLMDAARFVGNLEAAYRAMWRDWCKK